MIGLLPDIKQEEAAWGIMQHLGEHPGEHEWETVEHRLGPLTFIGEDWVVPPTLPFIGDPRRRRGFWSKLGRFLEKAAPVLGTVAGVALLGRPVGTALAKLSDVLRRSPTALASAAKTFIGAVGMSKAQQQAGNLAAAERYQNLAGNLAQAMQAVPPAQRQQALAQAYQSAMGVAAQYGQHHTFDNLVRAGMAEVTPAKKFPWIWIALAGGLGLMGLLAFTAFRR